MKSFAKLAVAGVTGVVLVKLFASILFPLVGMMLGLLAITVKLALIAAVIFFVYSMLRKKKDPPAADDGEIVVEAEEAEDEDD